MQNGQRSANGRKSPPPLPAARSELQVEGPADPLKGKILPGLQQSYEVIRCVGKGGMGAVYEAVEVDRESGKRGGRVAIKVLLEEKAKATDQDIDRFFREIGLNNSITNPNVVQLLDFGGNDNKPFLVEEFLDGKPLDAEMGDRMKDATLRGAMQWQYAAEVMIKALSGLEAVHAAGIIHRDMKPGNIFLLQNGGVKILDFGLARNREIDLSVTQTGMIMGTVHYLAPEQTGDDYDKRVDIYAAGVILYRMLCGALPFTSESKNPAVNMAEVIRMHREAQPVPPRQRRPDRGIPQELEAVVLKAMEKKPEDRYQSAAEMREALMLCLGKDPKAERAPQENVEIGARPPSGILIPTPSRTDTEEKEVEAPRKSAGARVALFAAKAALIGTLVGAGVVAYHYRDVISDYWHQKIVEIYRPEQHEPRRAVSYDASVDSKPAGAIVFEEITENGVTREVRLGETPLKLRLEGNHTFIIERGDGSRVRVDVTPARPQATVE